MIEPSHVKTGLAAWCLCSIVSTAWAGPGFPAPQTAHSPEIGIYSPSAERTLEVAKAPEKSETGSSKAASGKSGKKTTSTKSANDTADDKAAAPADDTDTKPAADKPKPGDKTAADETAPDAPKDNTDDSETEAQTGPSDSEVGESDNKPAKESQVWSDVTGTRQQDKKRTYARQAIRKQEIKKQGMTYGQRGNP